METKQIILTAVFFSNLHRPLQSTKQHERKFSSTQMIAQRQKLEQRSTCIKVDPTPSISLTHTPTSLSTNWPSSHRCWRKWKTEKKSRWPEKRQLQGLLRSMCPTATLGEDSQASFSVDDFDFSWARSRRRLPMRAARLNILGSNLQLWWVWIWGRSSQFSPASKGPWVGLSWKIQRPSALQERKTQRPLIAQRCVASRAVWREEF